MNGQAHPAAVRSDRDRPTAASRTPHAGRDGELGTSNAEPNPEHEPGREKMEP